MTRDFIRVAVTTAAFCTLLVNSITAQAAARKLYVAVNGVDSATCGTTAKPCRSISAAIDLASDGDTISVGPGLYSNLTGETAARRGLGTTVFINKAVHVLSSAGAERTMIAGPADGEQPNTVDVIASGAQLGAKDQGFTIIGASNVGVYVPAGRAVISGNVSINNFRGFSFESNDGQIIAQYNRATGGILGFYLGGARAADVVLASYNSATDASTGFLVTSSAPHVLTHNTAMRDAIGIDISGGLQVIHNTIEGSRSGGIVVECVAGNVKGSTDVSHNAVVANKGQGIVVGTHCENLARIHENNIYGNGIVDPSQAPDPYPNCGLRNDTTVKLDVTNNYWGAATGPGSDPADQACEAPSTTKPFATTPFAID